MARIEYTAEYIRKTEREKALEGQRKAHKMLAEKDKLVKAGKARWVKIPIVNGFILHFELL